jgi:hypothetical protein
MRNLLVVVLVVVVGLGAYLALRPMEAEQYERLRHAQALHAVAEARAEALAPFEVAALGGGLLAVVLLLAGAGCYGVANLRKRALLVHPNRHGLFPLVRVHIGGQVIVHDPNRQPTPAIVYAPDDRGGVRVTPVFLPELLDATRAAVAQAATVQAIRAGVSSGAGLLPEHMQRVAQSLFPTPDPAPRVRIIGDGAPVPQLDRLLTGGDDDAEPDEDRG